MGSLNSEPSASRFLQVITRRICPTSFTVFLPNFPASSGWSEPSNDHEIPAQHDDMRTAMNYAWALAAGIVLIDSVWFRLAGFHAATALLFREVAIFAALCVLWGIYARLRPDATIAALIEDSSVSHHLYAGGGASEFIFRLRCRCRCAITPSRRQIMPWASIFPHIWPSSPNGRVSLACWNSPTIRRWRRS